MNVKINILTWFLYLIFFKIKVINLVNKHKEDLSYAKLNNLERSNNSKNDKVNKSKIKSE